MRTSLLLISGLVASASLASGCASGLYGVSVTNKTDQLIRAEFVQVDNFGAVTSNGFQTISPSGEFRHKIDDEERTRGQRVRFTVADQSVTDGNWVMLNLPATRDRLYELQIVNGRLTAREVNRRPRSGPND